ncbi:isopentenyl phosphate kinase [Staphylothermus hellenicus]|uniref:Isopentenyl phosphate kinase n=1 Tax=Staphylothermus hellenicus (strain DSM 12710 / JCM 10830 / BK20S6-10-b1 / P8) TaxID=591019 RepID=D7DB77_STAHD|nr:isopentenyl phosphate kinase [Staphylothermus hellenicus]ADI31424.1 aspartate/glutamate/uridylate kinase [Staphylothermus hellenicus DSM 12710]
MSINRDHDNVVFVKLGGSFITYKDKPYSINYAALKKTVDILSSVYGKTRLLLGNGGGSFAHFVVEKYKMYDEKILLVNCHRATRLLNSIIVDYLLDHGLLVSTMQTSAIIYGGKRGFVSFIKPLKYLLRNNIIPSIYGECIIDENQAVRIVSTEEVFSILAEHIKVSRIVLLTDVEGVFTCDPKRCEDAELIPRIDRNNIDTVLSRLKETMYMDETGSIYGKVKYMASLSKKLRIPVFIVSGHDVENAVNAILYGKVLRGTVIDMS